MAPSATVANGTNGTSNGTNHGDGNVFQSRKRDLPQEAYQIVQERVPTMKAIDAVLELDIGIPEGVIYIDMLSEPCKILKEFDGEANCSVKIKPLYIKRFYEGAMDPRYGLFKDGELYLIVSEILLLVNL
jgi:hypothetical protein